MHHVGLPPLVAGACVVGRAGRRVQVMCRSADVDPVGAPAEHAELNQGQWCVGHHTVRAGCGKTCAELCVSGTRVPTASAPVANIAVVTTAAAGVTTGGGPALRPGVGRRQRRHRPGRGRMPPPDSRNRWVRAAAFTAAGRLVATRASDVRHVGARCPLHRRGPASSQARRAATALSPPRPQRR